MMKMNRLASYALLAVFGFAGTMMAKAETQNFDGIVSDSMCKGKHMMPGKSDAQCIQECVKSGSKYVLMVGSKMFVLDGKPQAIAPLAGKHVRIAGEVKGGTLSIQSIHEVAAH